MKHSSNPHCHSVFFKFELTDDDEVEADGVVDARYEGNVVDNAGQSWWDHSDLKNQ